MPLTTEVTVGPLLAEGKTKQVFEVAGEPEQVLVRSKDRITAHNALVAHDMQGKAACANSTNAAVFKYLNKAG